MRKMYPLAVAEVRGGAGWGGAVLPYRRLARLFIVADGPCQCLPGTSGHADCLTAPARTLQDHEVRTRPALMRTANDLIFPIIVALTKFLCSVPGDLDLLLIYQSWPQ